MGFSILVLGEPGTGKSRAIKGLDPKKTVIIKPNSKTLPFAGAAKSYVEGTNLVVAKTFKEIGVNLDFVNSNPAYSHITTVVIEDITHNFSKRVMDDSNKEGFTKWANLAKDAFQYLIDYESKLRPNLNLILIGHVEASTDVLGAATIDMQTPGKLLDRQIKIPSYFTYVFYTYTYQEGGKTLYKFLTNNDGIRLAKTPEGCFPKLIDNDYQYILDRIEAYQNGVEFEDEQKSVLDAPKPEPTAEATTESTNQ